MKRDKSFRFGLMSIFEALSAKRVKIPDDNLMPRSLCPGFLANDQWSCETSGNPGFCWLINTFCKHLIQGLTDKQPSFEQCKMSFLATYMIYDIWYIQTRVWHLNRWYCCNTLILLNHTFDFTWFDQTDLLSQFLRCFFKDVTLR